MSKTIKPESLRENINSPGLIDCHRKIEVRFNCGDSVNNLPSHDMCGGSAGGVVESVSGPDIGVARCNQCGKRVVIRL